MIPSNLILPPQTQPLNVIMLGDSIQNMNLLGTQSFYNNYLIGP